MAAVHDSVRLVGVTPDAVGVPGALGGTVSAGTVTLTIVDDPVLPAASVATVCKVCGPTAVAFHVNEYGAVVSVATIAPSTRSATEVTPMLSVALAVTVVEPNTWAPSVGAVMLVVGAVVSPATVTLTIVDDPVLPAASVATVCKVCGPTAVAFHVNEYGAVVSVATIAPSTRSATEVTPMLSVALAVTVVEPNTWAPSVGAVMLVVGAVVSAATVTLTTVERPVFPPASDATVCKVCGPTAVAFQVNVYGAVLSVADDRPVDS